MLSSSPLPPSLTSYLPCLTRAHTRRGLLAIVLATGTLIDIILAASYPLSFSLPAPSLTLYSPRPTRYRSRRQHPHCHPTRHLVLYNFLLSVTLRAALTMSQSSQSYSPHPTCYRPRRWQCAHRHPPHSRRAHRVVLISSCSSRCTQRVMSYLPTFLCFHVKCGSSIYRCTLDIMNRTGLSHYAWKPLRVYECNRSNCCNVPCLDSQRDSGAMTRVVQTPFALTRLRPEGKFPDTAASRRKMP